MNVAYTDSAPDGDRTNAILGWVLLCAVALSVVQSLLTRQYLWSAFEVAFVALAALPAAASRNWRVLVPWPLLSVGAVALVGQSLGFHQEFTGYTAVAAFALVAVGELEAFTDVEMTSRFAVAFAALTTMAVQGVWTVARYFSDQWLGSDLVRSQAQIQWDFVYVTLVALLVAAAFELYFRETETDSSPEEPATGDT